MKKDATRPKLVLIRGGESELGPVSRLGLWNRVPAARPIQTAILLGAKVLLLLAALGLLLAQPKF